MPVPSARALLREIDRLPVPERTRRLALLARDERWTTEFEVLTADLAAGDPFARRLALLLARLGDDPEIVARLVDDPDPGIAGSAVAAAARMGRLHGLLLDRVPTFSRLQRRGLNRAVRRHVLGTLADSLLEPVREHFGDVECAALLSGCTTSTVRAWLPELAYAVRNWAGLAHRHPYAVLAHLRRELAAAPAALRAGVWSRTGGAAAQLALSDPAALLDLLETSVADAPLPQELGLTWGVLARHDRDRVVRLLRDPRRTGSTAPTGRAFWRTLGDAPDADLAAVARDVGTRALPRFLAALPPSRRPVAVAGLAEGGRLPLPLALTVADLLPATARHAVAARLLDRAEVADDPRRRLAAVARQPWPQARDTLRAATTHPDAADRAAAYTALLTAATLARDPAVLGETLGELGRLRNEQDPVRCAALTALRRVPSWQVRRDDLAAWLQLCHDATQARDASPATLAAVSAIAGSLLREGAIRGDAALTDAAATLVGALAQHRAVAVRAAARDLPRGAETPLVAALLPRLESDAAQDRFTTTLTLAAALDRRAWDLPELQSLVDRARGAADDAIVRTAVGLWLAPPRTRSARVAAVLAADPSTIVLASVAAVVERSRTDLLDTVLKRPPRGRFLTGRGHHVPAFSPAPGVWLPRQVRAYAALLDDIIAGTGRPAWERCWAVRRRARLPGAVPLLRGLGDLDPGQEAVAEAALAALGHTDDPPAALAALLPHVDGERARVAVPAVRRCLDALPPELVGDPLARLLGSPKVTTRKDALRLLALHRPPGAGPELHARLTNPDEHRDVRRAAVPAARRLLDGREAAVVRPGLQVAVDEPVLATALLGAWPYDLPEHARPAYGRLVLELCDPGRNPDDVRPALGVVAQWTPWLDRDAAAGLGRHVVALDTTATWRPALTALVTTCELRGTGAALLDVADRLVDQLDRVEPGRDQPARQRLHALAAAVAARLAGPTALRPAARRLAARLDGRLDRAAVDLAARAVDWTVPDALAAEMSALAALTGPHVTTATDGLLAGLLPRVARMDEAAVRTGVEALAGHSAAGAAVAVGVVAGVGADRGWPPRWRAELETLRAHPDRRVRGDARDVVTEPE